LLFVVTRDLPKRHSFSPLTGGARPLPNTPAQTVERDWRQAMPRAEPALSLAPLRLPAVAGAAEDGGFHALRGSLTH
jgi:hypothetical protein